MSLATIAQKFGVNENTHKGIFPHSSNSSIAALKSSKKLPSFESGKWFDTLKNQSASPDQIKAAQDDFNNLKGILTDLQKYYNQKKHFSDIFLFLATNMYDYLLHYLKVTIPYYFHLLDYFIIPKNLFSIFRKMSSS